MEATVTPCPGEHIAAQSQRTHPWLATWGIVQALHHTLCPAKDKSLCVQKLSDLHTPEMSAADKGKLVWHSIAKCSAIH